MSSSGDCALPSDKGSTTWPFVCLHRWFIPDTAAFVSLVTSTLQQIGINDKQYNTHSFRIGVATTAKEAGISDVHIKMLRCWKSTAYQLYVRTPREKLAKLSRQMATGKDTVSAN